MRSAQYDRDGPVAPGQCGGGGQQEGPDDHHCIHVGSQGDGISCKHQRFHLVIALVWNLAAVYTVEPM